MELCLVETVHFQVQRGQSLCDRTKGIIQLLYTNQTSHRYWSDR
jgi:hypothetical protein